MRRLTSVLMGAAITLASVAGVAVSASAATPGKVTETATTALPTSPANMKVFRLVRLSRTGEFLAFGRPATAGSKYYAWQLKPDYTIDTTFGTNGMVELGVSDPASCNTQYSTNTTGCSSLRAAAYNEVSGTYVVAITRTVAGSNFFHTLTDVIIGDLKTGAVKTRNTLREITGSNSAAADTEFAGLNISAQNLSRDECTTVNGATINGALLRYGAYNSYNTYIVPNGSIIMQFTCEYSSAYDANGALVSPSGLNVKEYSLGHMVAYKVSGSSLVVDTTWGTAGRVSINKADSGKCVTYIGTSTSTDMGITSMSSTKPYIILPYTYYPRITTVPGNYQYATYEGCNSYSSQNLQYTNKLWSVTASGTVAEALDMGTASSPMFPSRWVIDPAGRWVSIARSLSVNAQPSSSTTYVAIRLANGKGDSTFATNGQKTLSLPSTVTVNGTSVSMNYSIAGMITTPDEVLYTGLSTASSQSSFNCGVSGTVTTTYRPFILSLKTGNIDTTYGTNGLGDGASYQYDQTDVCNSNSWGAATFVTSKGQPALLRGRGTVGSQTAGILAYTWETVANATGGGDGGTGTGGATKDTGGVAFTGEKAFSATATAGAVEGRVDTKVYTKAPAKVQENSAMTLLSAADADDMDIVSSTPAVCVALTTTVVFTGTGKCSVRIIDEETRKVIRTFSTTVAKAETVVGTVLTTDEPIYFKFVSSALTAKAKAQITALAEKAAGVGRILIVGHSASLYDNEVSNKRIAMNRAAAVKAALAKAGVKAPITVTSVGSSDPVSTVKTEAAQAKNRRVEIFFFPAAG